MKHLIGKNKFFLIPYILVLSFCIVLLFLFAKPELHILSNKANSPFFDTFFKTITHLGDGTMIAVLSIILLFVRYRYALVFLLGSIVTAGIINLLKKVILGTIYRPSKYFELYESYQLHFVDGVKLNSLQSFPSGHTGTAFNVFFMIALIVPQKGLKLVCFFGAALVGYSRVYLSQHFMVDITVGSMLGVLIVLLFYNWSDHWNKKWLNNSLLKKL